ncbi:unnamed protein product, partial [Ectocarpus fasciculatus]
MSRKPNIVLVAADGVGFADVGYNSAAGGIPTPSIDDLSAQGIRLNRNYVQSAATSSRASLLTGRYASNTGITRDIPAGSLIGLPEGVQTLPEVLKSLGYSTSMAGVWGLGHSQWGVCPTGKGFEEFTGSFTTGIDSETKSFHSTPWGAGGLDWIQAHDNGHYSHVLPMKLAADAISTEAQRMIKSHADVDADKPLFLYVSYSTVSQYDPKFQRECSRIPNLWRRQHCTAIAAIDEGVGAIAAAAEAALGEDTILIFTSTNGGSPWSGGLNAPYRGAGGSTLEGGIRVPAFVTDLSPDGRYLGSGNWSYNGMTHISDWFPSLISLAKGSVAS